MRFVEIFDAVGIGLDHGLDRGIGRLDGLGGGLRQLLRRDLLAGDELRQAQGIERGILSEFHRRIPNSWMCHSATGIEASASPMFRLARLAQASARAATRLTMSPMMVFISKSLGV